MGAVDRAGVIVAVCANPALDVTYRVPRLQYGQTHTVADVQVRPGGKGANVARVLRQLGVPVTLVAPLGGPGGAQFRELLDDVALVAVEVDGPTRTCVVVADDRDATVFNERGPTVTAAEWAALAARIQATLGEGDVLVLSGSLPPGAPPDAYAQLVTTARGRGARSIVDAHSAALDHALAAGPDVVAPNHAEARTLVGDHDLQTCAVLLRERGAAAAVVSAGPSGVYAATGDAQWSVTPAQVVSGNPTGAGDALTAAIAHGMHEGAAWDDLLTDAVACAAAAVACDVAGEVDLRLRAELLETTTAERH